MCIVLMTYLEFCGLGRCTGQITEAWRGYYGVILGAKD